MFWERDDKISKDMSLREADDKLNKAIEDNEKRINAQKDKSLIERNKDLINNK